MASVQQFDLLPTRFQLTTRPIEGGFAVKKFDASVARGIAALVLELKGRWKDRNQLEHRFCWMGDSAEQRLRGTARSFTDVDPQPSGDVNCRESMRRLQGL